MRTSTASQTQATPQAPVPIAGLHHVTAIARDPQANVDFYTMVLGLRLVKLTVNYDDPATYHVYFGNHAAEPGTILTFFPWPTAKRGVQGRGSVYATAFAVAPGSIPYWQSRLAAQALPVRTLTRFGASVVQFEDPDGMILELVEAPVATLPDAQPTATSDVPAQHALRGFHGVTLAVADAAPTAALLTQVMGYRAVAQEGGRHRFVATGPSESLRSAATFVDVLADPALPFSKLGAGVVHHVAFRTPDANASERWRERLAQAGQHATPIMDRSYFRSIYFREPGGVIFEFATDGPGFATDESPDALGTDFVLPAHLEPHRARIERAVPALTLPTGRRVPGVAAS